MSRVSLRTAERWMLAIGGVMLAVPLAAHATVGGFSRYMADDYCTAGTLLRLGFWDSQSFWYTTWSGRYAATFLVNLAEAAGVWVTRVLPALAILGWTAVLAVAFWRMGRRLRIAAPVLASVFLGAMLVVVILDGTPSPYQSLHWQTGMITYTLPLILLVGMGAWILRAAGAADAAAIRPLSLLGMAGLAFVAGGLSETYAVLQLAVIGVGSLAALIALRGARRRVVLALLGSAALGACLALLTIYAAPGTQIRRGMVSEPVTLTQLTTRLVQDARIFLSRTVRKIPAGLAAAVSLPLLVAFLWGTEPLDGRDKPSHNGRRLAGWLLLLPPVVAGLMLVSMAPYEFAISDYPDARVLITTTFILVTGMGVWGTLLGAALVGWGDRLGRVGRPTLAVLGILLVLAAVVPATPRALRMLPDAREFAAAWDRRDRVLRTAAAEGVDEIAVASLSSMGGLAEIGYDPEEWVNRCVAQAYGLKQVVAK